MGTKVRDPYAPVVTELYKVFTSFILAEAVNLDV